MIFDPIRRPPPLLHLRQPRPVWVGLGLVSAILAGAAATTGLVFFAEIPLRLANMAGADRLAWDALGAPLAAGQVFAVAGALAAIFVGAPWYAITHARPRHRRRGIVMEGFAIAIAAAFIAGALFGLVMGTNVLLRDGAETVTHWASALGVFAGSVLFFGVFGTLLAAPAGLIGGLTLSFVSYTYARRETNDPPKDLDWSY